MILFAMANFRFLCVHNIDAAQIQISKSKSQITKCQIPNSKFNLICQILNPKSQIFFLNVKSQIQMPNAKSQIILDLGSIYSLQYQVGTSSTTHMSDLNSLTQDSHFDGILKINDQIKPIWILLIDKSPDKNPRHIKNILQYCRIFRAFDLDYLSIRTHAPDQSAYNPVEHSMATLFQKLASITLPIDKYGSHLNSQGQVVDSELTMKNFCYAGEVYIVYSLEMGSYL
jgi:hypothetical protein